MNSFILTAPPTSRTLKHGGYGDCLCTHVVDTNTVGRDLLFFAYEVHGSDDDIVTLLNGQDPIVLGASLHDQGIAEDVELTCVRTYPPYWLSHF